MDAERSFGDWLRQRRKALDLTQDELAQQVGCSAITLRKLEAEERRPSKQIAERLAEVLQVASEERSAFLRFARGDPFAAPSTAIAESVKHGGETPARSHNLPIQLTSFVGREKEIGEVKRLLSTSPLVTLIGAGGCGKTRLALQVAAGSVAEYPNGVWLVELAPLSDPALVLPTVAATQDLREVPDRPLAKTLADHLHPKSLLLVLDNCEHVIQACAELAETLLRTCPNLKLLATSREALNIAGETALSVPSLSLPDVHRTTDVARMTQSEAVRLFVDRALAVKPDFHMTEANAPIVAQICLRLDGIPLALELAAVRVRALSLEQIAARLDDRFRLLAGGSRTALQRHQTLTALMDWSYDLLSEAERTVLRRLAVFWGGWTMEAAEAVCMGKGVEAAEVLNLLTHLVDKSLVVVDEHKGVTRYRLLETIREYALRRLLESGEAETIRRQHASFFLILAEAVKLRDETWGVWLKRFVSEHDNLRAALDWAFETDPDLGLKLVDVLGRFWFYSGYLSEGRGYLMRALEVTKAAGFTSRRAEVLHDAGRLAWQQGDYASARALLEESATLYREVGDKRFLALSLIFWGRIEAVLHGPQAALALQEEGIAILRGLGDLGKFYLANGLSYLGTSVAAQGDEETAHALQEESAALFREIGSKEFLATPLGYLGYLALRRGNYAEARSLFEESLRLWRGSHQWGIAWRLEGFAGLAAKEGQPHRAVRLYGAAQALLDSVGARLDPIDRDGYDQYVIAAREQLGEAAFNANWAEGEALTMEQAVDLALDEAAFACTVSPG